MKNIINIIVGLILMAISVYVITYIPTVIDFSSTIIRLENNDTAYQFLIYLPIIISIFNGVLALFNIYLKNVTLTIMNAIIAIGNAIFINMNVMGAITAIKSIGDKVIYIEYANILCAVLLIAEIIIYFVAKKKKKTN